MNHSFEYDRPIKIADGVFWVGFYDETSNFHCNPYLLIESNQAVLIDAGSRPDFAVVMSKILQTGIHPKQIIALIYQHYDPDLCGSMLNVVDICNNQHLKIISEKNNHIFINYYIGKDKHHLLQSIDEHNNIFTFNGRALQFFKIPYAHCEGSFVTYDVKTKTLFTSDLFGSFSTKWGLYIELSDACPICRDYYHCMKGKDYCPLPDIIDFHRRVMPSSRSLRYAIKVVKELDISMIAPQHGSIIAKKHDIDFITDILYSLDKVGIDAIEPLS